MVSEIFGDETRRSPRSAPERSASDPSAGYTATRECSKSAGVMYLKIGSPTDTEVLHLKSIAEYDGHAKACLCVLHPNPVLACIEIESD